MELNPCKMEWLRKGERKQNNFCNLIIKSFLWHLSDMLIFTI